MSRRRDNVKREAQEEWDGCGDLVGLIHSLNFHRRHLSVSQKAKVGVGYKRELQETVKQGNPTGANQYSPRNGGNNTTIPTDISAEELLPPSSSSVPVTKARDVAAAKVGVSGKVVDLAEKIEEKAPDLYARIGLHAAARPAQSPCSVADDV